ncbi:topoisomerase DNA-binding C4 zinc finger domain-containing protein, partial [Glaesserella parasuis]
MSLFKSTKQTELCPQCHSPLQLKRGKQGLFLGCSSYPQCDYLKPIHQASHIIKTLDEQCPECQSPLQLKQGHFGMFIGCSQYPDCHFTVHEEAEIEEEFDCPECQKHKLVARTGRSGKTFYGCSGFPECKFTLPTKPIKQQCPQCLGELATIKKVRGKSYFLCAN